MAYQQPGISNPEDKFAPKDNLGATLLIFPREYRQGVKTEHGESDTVAAKVVRLDDGRVFPDALLFSVGLVNQLKGAVPDGEVLGILGQGENKKGNAPWILKPHTPREEAMADAWHAANPVQQYSQPQAPQGPPTQSGWGAPATPAAPAWGGQAPAAPAPTQGGWGAPAAPPAQAGWGAPAAPAPSGWGAPAPAAPSAPPAAPSAYEGQWGGAAPVAPPVAPPVSEIHPGLVAALTAAGYPPPPGTSQAAAEQLAASLGLTPQ